MTMNTHTRPPFQSITLQAGLSLGATIGYHYSEKMDGINKFITIGQSVLWCELMADGRRFVLDCVTHYGQDVRSLAFRDRLTLAKEIIAANPSECLLLPLEGANPTELLKSVIERGGEGIVGAFLNGNYWSWRVKCKRVETLDLVVAEKAGGKSSIRLKTIDGQNRGWCSCRAAYDSIKVGDIVEIAVFGIHGQSGLMREPRFVKIRHDKMVRVMEVGE
jgi:hypothetical protein